jgi:hypothetical protein
LLLVAPRSNHFLVSHSLPYMPVMKLWITSPTYIAIPTKEGAPSPPPSPSSTTPRAGARQFRILWKLLLLFFLPLLLLLLVHLRAGIPALLGGRTSHALPLPDHVYFGDAPHSSPRIWGEGLYQARQNLAATFYIDFDETEHPPLSVDEDLSIMLVGPSRHAASAVYAGKGRFVVTYTALDAGEYTLRIDVYRRAQVSKPYVYWRPLGLDSYNVTVVRQDGSLAQGSGRHELAFPPDLCTGEEDASEGRWVRCEDTPLACVRYGWIWLPRTCHYHIYTAEELAEQDLWIAVVGTSVFRGIFFAGLDHLLGERAEQLSSPSSRFWKCWGRLSVAVHRLRLSYLDFREQCIRTTNEELCVGDYSGDAEQMLEQMGREREGQGPDMVLWEVNANAARNFSTLATYRRWLGEGWAGVFLASHRIQSPEAQWAPDDVTALSLSASSEPEAGVEAFDLSVSLS